MTTTTLNELRIPALEIRQGPNRLLYSFAVDGKQLRCFTTVSRVHRNDDSEIAGYQRPEVRSHITEIRNYIESEDAMLPNAIVVAFNSSVTFVPADVSLFGPSFVRVGTLVIPVDEGIADEDKPGWIVDGQQRAAAVREADIERFPMCVTSFIAADDREHKEQFILVNSTKPLPKGLIYELLPTTDARLSSLLQKRRFPALLSDRLNHDERSPLRGKIQTPTTPNGLVKDNSILKMLENSLNDGVLYRFRDPDTGRGDVEKMLTVLCNFWGAVAKVFSDAWALPPRRSRLMHGAGITSLGFVMDAIADRYRSQDLPTEDMFREDLEGLRDICRWTDGYWDFGLDQKRKWNEIQNTSKDIYLLSNHLLIQYKLRVWNKATRTSSYGT